MGKGMKNPAGVRWYLQQMKWNVKESSSETQVHKGAEQRDREILMVFIFRDPEVGEIHGEDKTKEVLINKWKMRDEEREGTQEEYSRRKSQCIYNPSSKKVGMLWMQ